MEDAWTTQTLARLIDAMHATIQGHAAQLDALDDAIGDGDHGTNLARGLDAVVAERERITALPLGQALQEIGWVIEREAGGAGGTYYGLLLKAAGGVAPAGRPGPDDLLAMLQAGIEAIQAKGGARKGEKTMLDVLIPVAQGMRSLIAAGTGRPDRRPDHRRGRARPARDHADGGQARPRRRSRCRQRQPPRRRSLLVRAAVRCRGGCSGRRRQQAA